MAGGSVEALLFDLDGTLADTDPLHLIAWAEALLPHGIEVDEEFYRTRMSGRLNPDIVAELLPHLSPREAEDLVHSKEARVPKLAEELEPLPGLVEFLRRTSGIPRALVTNAPRDNAEVMLGVLGLEEAFDTVVLAEDVGAGKPDPAPYLAALEKLQLAASDTLAFEDSPSGIRSAVAAGIPTVGIASTHPPESLEEAGAFTTTRDFQTLDLEHLARSRPGNPAG
jgi:HAD superfamily hydrolase (TIGR01509 family)